MSFINARSKYFINIDDHEVYDATALQDHQQECLNRYLNVLLLEQYSYLRNHPEIKLMLKGLISQMMHRQPLRMNHDQIISEAANYFTSLDKDGIKNLKKSLNKHTGQKSMIFSRIDEMIEKCQDSLTQQQSNKFEEKKMPGVVSAELSTTNTDISSFMSIITSKSSLITPEKKTSQELSSTEIYYNVILSILDRAVCSQITEEDILYDISNEHVMKAVEAAMEIPVQAIRQDVEDLLKTAYYMFKLKIEEKRRIAVQKEKNNKAKRKWKEILRRLHNYKGYNIQQEKRSFQHFSKQPDYNRTKCHYNRYPKDSFGVYLPQTTAFSEESVTMPVYVDETTEQDEHILTDTISLKSRATMKSGVLLTAFLCDGKKKFKYIIKGKNPKGNRVDKPPESTSAYTILFKPGRKLFRKM